MMKTEIYQKIQDFLINNLNPAYIIVFGSYAKGTSHRDSDIDVAFFCENSFHNPYEVFLLAQELADDLKIEIDLVNLETASTIFKAQIHTTGTVIYTRDEFLLKNHQMIALSMYAKLNEEREIILKNISKGGSIYEK